MTEQLGLSIAQNSRVNCAEGEGRCTGEKEEIRMHTRILTHMHAHKHKHTNINTHRERERERD